MGLVQKDKQATRQHKIGGRPKKTLLEWLVEDATAPGSFTTLDCIYAWLRGHCKRRPSLVNVHAVLRSRYGEMRRKGSVGYPAILIDTAVPWLPQKPGFIGRVISPAAQDRLRQTLEWWTLERRDIHRHVRLWRTMLEPLPDKASVMYIVFDALGRGMAPADVHSIVLTYISRQYPRTLSDGELLRRLKTRQRTQGGQARFT